VTTDQATRETTSSDRRRLPGTLRSSASCLVPTPGAPNKPVVPTAHDVANGSSMHPMRRHTGQSLEGHK